MYSYLTEISHSLKKAIQTYFEVAVISIIFVLHK